MMLRAHLKSMLQVLAGPLSAVVDVQYPSLDVLGKHAVLIDGLYRP